MAASDGDEIDTTYDYMADYNSIQRGGLDALIQDIRNVQESDFQVPPDLDWHVYSSAYTQLNWYKKLSKAWKASKPMGPDDSTKLVHKTLESVCPSYNDDVQGFCEFYGIPCPTYTYSDADADSDVDSDDDSDSVADASLDAPLFEFCTLPVICSCVKDGGGFIVFVEVKDLSRLPQDIVYMQSEHYKALLEKNYAEARDLLLKINNTKVYKLVNFEGEEVLTKRFHIRLRGIRVRKTDMLDGTKARDELAKLVTGKRLMIKVFCINEQHHCFGDVYYNSKKLQDILIKREDASCYWEEVKLGMEDVPSQ